MAKAHFDENDLPENDLHENGSEEKSRCLNCNKKLPNKAVFCPKCGQRNNKGKVSMRELFQRFWNNFTHLDSKFVKMCWQLFLPARVTMEYFRGRQKRYPHPMQFFFIVMFFFLLLFKSCVRSGGHVNVDGQNATNLHISTDSAKVAKRPSPETFNNSLQRYVAGIEMKAWLDSLPPHLNTPTTHQAFDSVFQIVNHEWASIRIDIDSTKSGQRRSLDTIPITLFDKIVPIAVVDIARLEAAALADKYDIRDWRTRLMFAQAIKSLKNPSELINAYLGSLTWTILALITLMSGVLALLYWTQRRFFVEHFVFLIHQHSGAYLAIAALLLLDKVIDVHLIAWGLLFMGIGIHLCMAMRRFYGESVFWTCLKWAVYCLLYIFGFVSLFVVGMFLVFVIF